MFFRTIIWCGCAALMLAAVSAAPYAFAISDAASIYLSPAGGVFTVGSTFEVGIYLNTGGTGVNAVRVDLSFPPDKLQVVSPTLGRSILPLWVIQPTFSNTSGTIVFEGGIPPPGLNTSEGLISSVIFRVVQVGEAAVVVQDSSRVYRADGTGINILGARTDGLFSFKLPPPQGPRVVAPKYPDPNQWYREDDVEFVWEMPAKTSAVSYVLNDNPLAIPDDIPEGIRTSVLYRDVPSGIQYFHIKALQPDSGWGGTSHYQVNIDDDPPAEFGIEVLPDPKTVVVQPTVVFSTTDVNSGLSHYALRVIQVNRDDKDVSTAPFFIEATSPFVLPRMERGSYRVVVRAYDIAGNVRDAETPLTIRQGLFRNLGPEGIGIRSDLTLPWWAAYMILGSGAGVLLWLAHFAYRGHRAVEQKLAIGVLHLIEHRIASRMALLNQKRQEFETDRFTKK